MDITDLRKYGQISYDYSREEDPERAKVFMHLHDHMELYFLIEGDVEYLVENHIYHPKAGDIMLLRPGELHSSKVNPAHTGPYERYNFRFSPTLLKETLNGRLLLPFLNRPAGVCNLYTSQDIPSDFIHACFRRMFAGGSKEGEADALSYLIPILQEVYNVWSTRELPQEDSPNSLPARIVAYINENLATLRSPQELADAFYLSQSQVCRTFREYTGTSVWNYVRTKRLITARERMHNGDSPTQAAAACGFEDYSTFFRGYKQQFGRTPREDCTHRSRR